MERSAVVLAGGESSRIGEDKGTLRLAGKPLLNHVIDAVRDSVDEVVVVTNSEERVKGYSAFVEEGVKFVRDQLEIRSPLIGAMSGFSVARGRYSLLLPFDTPFLSGEIISMLFKVCAGGAAAIPKWPNGQIEPLHAVYETSVAREAAMAAIALGRRDMRGMIERMHGIRYVSTLVMQQLDPDLETFFNINTRADLKRAEILLRQRKQMLGSSL